MAIALDVASNGVSTATSPLTWSHTVVSGSNLLLVVGVTVQGTTPNATAVTYNGVSMNKVQSNTQGVVQTSVWLLHAPATGANTISVSFTGTGPHCMAGAVSYTGAQQSDAADAVNGLTGTTTGVKSFNVTTISDNCWVFCVAANENSPGAALTATQTQRWNAVLVANDSVGAGEDTNAPVTPAGAQAMGWTVTNGTAWAMSGASFAPAAAAAPTPATFARAPTVMIIR